jgi:uncharacterized membrane protein
MQLAGNLSGFTPADWAALAFLVAAWALIGHFTEYPPKRRPSVSTLMRRYRREWMRQFVTREPRIFDASIIDSLRQGISFYVSACLIAIGGGVALVGNPERLQGLAGDLAALSGPQAAWQAKVLLVLLFLTNALLKFVWSHRLFGYCAILMAAVPNDPADPAALPRALQAAGVNIHAAKNFNQGLRSVYFALAGLGWLFGPLALALTTALTLYVTWRREFASNSRRVLIEGQPPDA